MSQPKKSKRSRASNEQLRGMVDFFDENPGMASGKFQKLHGKLALDKKWEEMELRLNAMGGAHKSVEQWRTVWRDLKSRTSNKKRDRNNQLSLTGNRPVDQPPLNDLEQRVAAIMGSSYIEGNDASAENVPQEEEFQLRMEEDDEEYVEVTYSGSPIAIAIDTPVTRSNCATPVGDEVCAIPAACATPAAPATPTQQTPRKSSRKNKGAERSELESKFLAVAQTQADAMKMLAETMAKHVQLQKMLAETMAKHVELQTSLVDGMRHFGNAMNACASAIDKLATAIVAPKE